MTGEKVYKTQKGFFMVHLVWVVQDDNAIDTVLGVFDDKDKMCEFLGDYITSDTDRFLYCQACDWYEEEFNIDIYSNDGDAYDYEDVKKWIIKEMKNDYYNFLIDTSIDITSFWLNNEEN